MAVILHQEVLAKSPLIRIEKSVFFNTNSLTVKDEYLNMGQKINWANRNVTNIVKKYKNGL